jgi:hypothetical protein
VIGRSGHVTTITIQHHLRQFLFSIASNSNPLLLLLLFAVNLNKSSRQLQQGY